MISRKNIPISDSVCLRLVEISEYSVKLLKLNPSIGTIMPISQMTSLRNRIVHDYGCVDKSIIYNTAKYDLDKLKKAIENHLKK